MIRCQWKLFLITSIFLTSVISTPIIEKIISQLCQQGFGNDIVSSEDFQRSLTCAKCRTSLTFGPGQGPWTLKRHAWTISEDYNVVSLRRSGKSHKH